MNPRSDGALAPVAKPNTDQLLVKVPELFAGVSCSASATEVIPRFSRFSAVIATTGEAVAVAGFFDTEPVTMITSLLSAAVAGAACWASAGVASIARPSAADATPVVSVFTCFITD